MNLLWPYFLLLFGLIPLLVAWYIWNMRRRRPAIRYSSLFLIREALPRHSRLRRHLPFVLFLVALTSLVFALGRPVAFVEVPAGQSTIILAMDVSRSMRQMDVTPSRLHAAKAAALSYVERLGPSTQIGIVAFSGFAELIRPPTTDQESLQSAVSSLTTGRRTAIGSGILKSLEVISDIEAVAMPSISDGSGSAQTYRPAIIVLLTDGVSTTGPDPLEAAAEAAAMGIRVYTIGFGTDMGEIPLTGQDPNNNQAGGDPFSTWADPFGGFSRGIDEATLKEIASLTGGTYYSATSTSELQEVFKNLPTTLITRRETTEITVAFAALGALLTAVAFLLSLLWRPLP